MKSKTKKSEDSEMTGGWASILWSMAENALAEAGSAALEKVDSWMSDLKRSAVSTIFVLIGAIFFLISLVLYVNTLVPDEMRWLGFIVGGIFSISIGLFFSRK
jgi:hypothetical protein